MKAIYDSQDAIPEAIRAEYEEKDGKFVLKVDGDHPVVIEATKQAVDAARQATELKAKLEGFRENNTTLLKELGAQSFDDAKQRLKELKKIDPAEYERLKDRTRELEGQGIRTSEDVTRLFLERTRSQVEAAVKPLQDELSAIRDRERRANEALARTTLENALRDAGVKAGVDEKAMPDFLNRGMSVFAIKDGQVVALKNGEPQFSRRKAGESLTAEEWAQDLATDAPHLFRPSRGGGAPGSAGSAPRKRYVSGEPLEFGSNLEAIARGEVSVQS
jgi:hypothetical protein